MPRNNIIVLDSYFNLRNKHLIRFFDHFAVAYFFGATLYTVLVFANDYYIASAV